MNRRSFLRSMFGATVGGVAAAAAVRTFPFRVFSFPKQIVVPRWLDKYGRPSWSEVNPFFSTLEMQSPEFLLHRHLIQEEICRIFNVPPHLVFPVLPEAVSRAASIRIKS